MPVAAQENAEIVKPGDDALQLDTVDQKNRQRRFALAAGVQERVLQVLLTLAHGLVPICVLLESHCWPTYLERDSCPPGTSSRGRLDDRRVCCKCENAHSGSRRLAAVGPVGGPELLGDRPRLTVAN